MRGSIGRRAMRLGVRGVEDLRMGVGYYYAWVSGGC